MTVGSKFLEIYSITHKPCKNIENYMQKYVLDNDTYEKVSKILLQEMEKGLHKDTNPDAKVKMFPTYVRHLPDGSERGHFLALDLGGTNFRVLLITLDGETVEMKNRIYSISSEVMTGPGTQLFDHIAACIAQFTKENGVAGKKLPLGFTFSFPCKQEGLNVARLVTWTKGFNCDGVVGNDVVQLLHEAIKRREDIDVECTALINDTVGCLMSCAFSKQNCEVGVILGTGTNACYVEKLGRVNTWDGDDSDPQQVIINTEWGAFGDNGVLDFIRTDVDKEVDRISLNPGKQTFEKMISGMYMGEIARRVIVQCAQDGLLFGGELTEELKTQHLFYTKYISEIEKDEEGGSYEKTKQVLDELGIEDPTMEDCRNVQYICQCVSRRAAFLASAGIATLLNRINKPNVTVAVDGSLYRYHPHFHQLMMNKIQELLKPGLAFESIDEAVDGSGKGAALVAAVINLNNSCRLC